MPDARVCVLGGGPAGDVAALRAAQLGAEVVLVERGLMGGTCVNRGCIPTKALLAGSELVERLSDAAAWGIAVGEVGVDWPVMRDRAMAIAERMRAGVEGACANRGVQVVRGDGWLSAPGVVTVETDDGVVEIAAPTVVIATGSEPTRLPLFDFEQPSVLTSTSALEMERLPASMIIVGGGIIGCEFASMLAPLGCSVTIIEALPRLLATEEARASTTMARAFRDLGVEVLTDTQVVEVTEYRGDGLTMRLSDGSERAAETVLVAVGRTANTVDIGLAELGIQTERGQILVDERLRTGADGVYAVGDAIPTEQLAHLGQAEGAWAVEDALEGPHVFDRGLVPACIYTHPEIARVGLTEEAARAAGWEVAVGAGRLGANGKALALGETLGFARIVADRTTDRVLGATIMGPHATDLIHELGLALAHGISVSDVGSMIHAHPTVAESVMDAAHNLHGIELYAG
ncbi:MAG: dihydrolipoyl dehydrogenase [Miltoncostaeaceae bacterium]